MVDIALPFVAGRSPQRAEKTVIEIDLGHLFFPGNISEFAESARKIKW
jgi:hypothetical protein